MSQKAEIKTLTSADGETIIYPRTTKDAVSGLANIVYAQSDEVEMEVKKEFLKYTPQSFTEDQKAQARLNIGAADSSTVALKTHLCNPNLLDNWYFGNPVNQRGKTEYTATGYTIDRWRLPTTHKHTVVDNGLKVTINASAGLNYAINQIIENWADLVGKTITLSMLVVENTCAGEINIRFNDSAFGSILAGKTGLFSITYTVPDTITEINIGVQPANRSINDGRYFVLAAMKMELGDTQTLAHQENGVWVLNEIPDYGEQLARCQRYFVNLNSTHKNWFTVGSGYMIDNTTAELVVPIPITMRAYPSIVTNGFSFSSPSGSGGLTSASIYNMGSSSLNLHCVTTNGVAKEPCFAYASAEQYVWLSADL